MEPQRISLPERWSFLLAALLTAASLLAQAPTFTQQPRIVWTSPSSIAVSFTTSIASSVVGECGTQSGGPYTASVTPSLYTEGYQRTNFTGTAYNWGNAVAIPGLHQSTLYYCIIVATANSQSTNSNEFSIYTTALNTTPMTVSSTAEYTRTNDYMHGLNGLPALGCWNDGDTQYHTWAANGEIYGACHDCLGQNGGYNNAEAWFSRDSNYQCMTQIDGQLGFGTEAEENSAGWSDNGYWLSAGVLSVNGVLYMPVDRWTNGTATYAFNVLKTTDYWAHSINAYHAYNNGPNATVYTGADVPASGTSMPNVPTIASGAQVQPWAATTSNGCQDQTINCFPQANDDAFVYDFGFTWYNSVQTTFLTRIRREDLPLMDGAKWQCYTGPRGASNDDGLYDANWSSTFTGCTSFTEEIGFVPSMTFIPGFNRWMFVDPVYEYLNNGDGCCVDGKHVLIADHGPYPWNTVTIIGAVHYTDKTWPTYQPEFGQVASNSFTIISTSPLSARVKITTTGNYMTTTSNPDTDQYSLFLTEVTLVARIPSNKPSRVSATRALNTHIQNGLDLYYNFRGQNGDTYLYNLSPNDPTGQYNISAGTCVNYSPGNNGVFLGVSWSNCLAYNDQGLYNFGYGQPSGITSYQITGSYSHTGLTSATVIAVWRKPANYQTDSYGAPININDIQIERSGSTANTWLPRFQGTNLPTFTATDGTYIGVAWRWTGSAHQIFLSTAIESTSALPLVPTVTSTFLGTGVANLVGPTFGGTSNWPFYGVMCSFLTYSRALSDSELIQEFNTLRNELSARGATLP